MSVMKKAIFGAITAVAMAGVAQASVFQIVPVISAEYTSAGTLDKGALGGTGLTPATPGAYITATSGDIYAVDFYVKYTPTAGEPSFGNMTFNLVPGGDAARLGANIGAAKVNYTPVSTLFDNNGAGPDTPELAFNADAGNDWQSVLVGIDNTLDTSSAGAGDPRPTIGQTANGFLFGRAFVKVTGAGATSGTFAETLSPAGSGSPPSVWLSSTTGQLTNPADALVTNGLASFTVAAVPEPTTLSLLGLGALGLIRRRRQA